MIPHASQGQESVRRNGGRRPQGESKSARMVDVAWRNVVKPCLMKYESKFLLPVALGIVCTAVLVLAYMHILPYEMIPGAPFDLSILPMRAIFWLVYFIVKLNVFEPLMEVISAREDCCRQGENLYRDAE